MMKIGSAKVTDENRWLFLVVEYWAIILSWVLAPIMLLLVLSISLWTIVVGRFPLDRQQMVLHYTKWESVAILFLIFFPAALLFYFLGRFGTRYVSTVRAGKLPWPWPPN